MPLPTEPQKPSQLITDYSWMFYGTIGTGKSTLACQFPRPLWINSGESSPHLAVPAVYIHEWKDFVTTVKELLSTKHEYQTIIIDTFHDLYEKCEYYVCRKSGVNDPSEGGHGKLWAESFREFKQTMDKLKDDKFCLVFIAHEARIEITQASGKSIQQAIPLFSKRGRQYATTFVDNIGYLRSEIDPASPIPKRILTFHGSPLYEAKNHFPLHLSNIFPTQITINKGNTPIGYQELEKAFEVKNEENLS